MAVKKFFIAEDQLKSDYQELSSMLKVAEKYGVSKKLVMNYMNRYGIERNKRPKWSDTVGKISSHFKEGVTTAEVAEATGYSSASVLKAATEVGFKLTNTYHTGEIITHNGYRMIPAPAGHPDADSKGYIREHRLIMERKIGRRLKSDEVVHHINHDKLDNSLSNLELTTLADHTSHHHTGKAGRGPDLKPRKRK